jgi:hypothetical protein
MHPHPLIHFTLSPFRSQTKVTPNTPALFKAKLVQRCHLKSGADPTPRASKLVLSTDISFGKADLPAVPGSKPHPPSFIGYRSPEPIYRYTSTIFWCQLSIIENRGGVGCMSLGFIWLLIFDFHTPRVSLCT